MFIKNKNQGRGLRGHYALILSCVLHSSYFLHLFLSLFSLFSSAVGGEVSPLWITPPSLSLPDVFNSTPRWTALSTRCLSLPIFRLEGFVVTPVQSGVYAPVLLYVQTCSNMKSVIRCKRGVCSTFFCRVLLCEVISRLCIFQEQQGAWQHCFMMQSWIQLKVRINF